MASVALAGLAAVSATPAASGAECSARPAVDEFVAALNGGDLDRLEELFAPAGDGWVWYFVNDRAGRRLGSTSRRRDTLRMYFAARIARHETLRVLRFEDGGNGNFTFVVRRRADDLRGGRSVERGGKGWVSCTTGKIGVWGLGGKPPPPTFGPCVRGALPVGRGDLDEAAAAVGRFVRNVYVELAPSVDVARARIGRAAPAVGNPMGYTARVRCGRAIQRRTIAVEVQFPRLDRVAFYVSRTRTGWLVWRLVR